MTAQLGETRDPAALIPGDVVTLHDTAAQWRARAQRAEEAAAKLSRMRTVSEWRGESADAYEGRVTRVAAGWSAMATAFRAGQAALEEVAAAIDAARARASDAVDLWDSIDLPHADESRSGIFDGRGVSTLSLGPRLEASAILNDARTALDRTAREAAAALRAAITIPDLGADEWAALLTGSATPAQVLDALANVDAVGLGSLLTARPTLAAILPQAPPAEVVPWWAGLDDAQKDALIHAAPALIGNLGGVAYAARDEANRLWLDTQLDEALAALAEAEKPATFDEVLGGRGAAVAHAERLEHARARLAGLENIEASLKSPSGSAPRHLITLTADSPPLAAISIGELDTADNIAYAIPGMGTTTEGMDGWSRAAQNLVDQQDRVDPGRSHAVVAWIGYKTPPVPLLGGGFDVMHNDLAEAGASSLAKDLSALDSVNSAARLSVVAHSYGTTTASVALTNDQVHVDAFVTLGSAGLPADIDRASELHAGEVFSGQAQDVWAVDPAGGDQWAWTGRLAPDHPVNPISPEFGAQAFGVAGSNGLEAVTDHGAVTSDEAGYLDRRTESLRNVALATTGHPDRISPYVPPGPTPFQQALIEGMTNGLAN